MPAVVNGMFGPAVKADCRVQIIFVWECKCVYGRVHLLAQAVAVFNVVMVISSLC